MCMVESCQRYLIVQRSRIFKPGSANRNIEALIVQLGLSLAHVIKQYNLSNKMTNIIIIVVE